MNRRERRKKNKANSRVLKLIGGRGNAGGQLIEAEKFFSAGNYEKAIEIYERIITKAPDNSRALMYLGAACFELNRLSEAEDAFRRWSKMDPSNGEAWRNLGLVYCHQRKFGSGIGAFTKAVEAGMDDKITNANLGLAYSDVGPLRKAEEHFRKALIFDNNDNSLKKSLANVLVRQGNLGEGRRLYSEVLSKDPEDLEGLLSLARVNRELGDLAGAVRLLNQVLSIDEQNAEAWFILTMVTDREEIKKHIAPLENILNNPQKEKNSKITAGFGIGEVYHRLGEAKKAFFYIAQANQRKRQGTMFDLGRYTALAETIFETYSEKFIAESLPSGFEGLQPIFIFGMPRSGTTLVEQIVATHSLVTGMGEYPGISDEAKKYDALRQIDSNKLGKIGLSYAENILESFPDAKRVTDKGLDNYFYVGLIALALPHATLINCMRNPIDNCFSCYQQLFQEGQEYSYNLGDLGNYYRLYRKIIDHWDIVFPGKILHVYYEDLVQHQEKVTRKILGHCKLDYEESCLQFYKTPRQIKTASAEQVRRPIYGSSVEKWRAYEEYLEELLLALGPYSDEKV